MSSIPMKDMQGASVGSYDMPDDLLEFEKGMQAMQEAVVRHLANKRQGSASTKDKSEVRGSGRKLWKQKGTGRARVATRQSPIWRGGGITFGPHPRSFRKDMNKKVARLAFRRAFSEKVKAEHVTVIDAIKLDEPKTKLIAEMCGKLEIGKNALLLVGAHEDNVALACRNLPNVELQQAANANTYQVLKYQTVLCTCEAMDVLKERLAR